MKRFLIFLFVVSAVVSAETKPAQKPAQKPAKSKAAADANSTKTSVKTKPSQTAQQSKASQPHPTETSPVPKDAVKISDLEWRHVDKDGKAWIYRRTPFAINKIPEEQAIGASAAGSAAGLEARDLGDSVEFSRRTPFGTNKWVKKKSELDSTERAALDAVSNK